MTHGGSDGGSGGGSGGDSGGGGLTFPKDRAAILNAEMSDVKITEHGVRKGSTVRSGTAMPVSFSSVAARGEWSMGKVLDVYWAHEEARRAQKEARRAQKAEPRSTSRYMYR